jgi:hypothetical protein
MPKADILVFAHIVSAIVSRDSAAQSGILIFVSEVIQGE